MAAFGGDVLRDKQNFPQCVELKRFNVFFKWKERTLSRDVYFTTSSFKCSSYNKVVHDRDIFWHDFKLEKLTFLDKKIIEEIKQIEQKTNELREHFSVEDYLAANPIKEYTVETNRDLTRKYGQIFSALVFKHLIEQEKSSQELLQKVISDLNNKKKDNLLPNLKDKVRLVVSFGLGWEEKYSKYTPQYVINFLNDIKSLGLPVTFLSKDPFGTVAGNVQLMIPQVEEILKGKKDIIYISLCKGTPELFAATADVLQRLDQSSTARIIGHVNLSGMLSGAIFSDFAKEIVVPKLVAPLMKLIPFNGIADSAKMVDAIEYMQTSIIEESLESSSPYLTKDIFTINVTGAPMSTKILEGNSPMKPVVKYSAQKLFIDSANDGFLELPSTLIPKNITTNQATLVLDSTHMLSDGSLHGYELGKQEIRRSLYQTVIETIINKDPQLAGLLQP
jgi:hypothetical protein